MDFFCYGNPFFCQRGGDLFLTLRGGASPSSPPCPCVPLMYCQIINLELLWHWKHPRLLCRFWCSFPPWFLLIPSGLDLTQQFVSVFFIFFSRGDYIFCYAGNLKKARDTSKKSTLHARRRVKKWSKWLELSWACWLGMESSCSTHCAQ